MAAVCFKTLVFSLALQVCLASVDITISFVSFKNSKQQLADGTCCDMPGMTTVCLLICDPVITVCLSTVKELQHTIEMPISNNVNVRPADTSCNLYQGVTGVFEDSDHFDLKHNMGGVPNPLKSRVGNWHNHLFLRFEVNDMTDGNTSLIDTVTYRYRTSDLKQNGRGVFISRTIRGQSVTFTFHTAAECSKGYYGPTCSSYCNPNHLPGLHYTCGPTGKMMCQRGWAGPKCSIKNDACAHNQCRNNATCVINNNGSGFTCHCMPPYKGIFCQDTNAYVTTTENEIGTVSSNTTSSVPMEKGLSSITTVQTPISTTKVSTVYSFWKPTNASGVCNSSQAVRLEIDYTSLNFEVLKDTIRVYLKQFNVTGGYGFNVSGRNDARKVVKITITSLEEQIRRNIVLALQRHIQNMTGKKTEIKDVSCRPRQDLNKTGLIQHLTRPETSDSTGTIVGATVGLLVLVCIITVAILMSKRWGRRIFPKSMKDDNKDIPSAVDADEKIVLCLMENTRHAINSSPPIASALK